MKQEKWYHILEHYFRQHLSVTLMLLSFVAIFAAIFRLYDLETEAVLYATGLCLLFALVVITVHFIFYLKEHQERMRILKNICLLVDELPEAKTLAENDLLAMIRELKKINEVTETARQTDRRESLDYYTTWIHQIKTPISTMKMILESEDTDEHRELLAELFRIEQYVEMVLMFLRLDSDTTDYVIREYDLDAIIRQAVRKFAGEFIARKIQLVYEPVNTKVITDEKWLSFVVEQVLSNALKYTPAGSISISLETPKTLCIRDTGMGIAPEDLPRIFEKGYTGYHGRADKKASGIGLYLCKRVCSNLGHTITAKSKVDTGTTIEIDLSQAKLEIE